MTASRNTYLQNITLCFRLETTVEVAEEKDLAVGKLKYEACIENERQMTRAARVCSTSDVKPSAVLSEAVSGTGGTSSRTCWYESYRIPNFRERRQRHKRSIQCRTRRKILKSILDALLVNAESGGLAGDTDLITRITEDFRVGVSQISNTYVLIDDAIERRISVGREFYAAMKAMAFYHIWLVILPHIWYSRHWIK